MMQKDASPFNQVEMILDGSSSDASTQSKKISKKITSVAPIRSVGGPAWNGHDEEACAVRKESRKEEEVSRPSAGRLPRVIALVLGLVTLLAVAGGLCLWIAQHPHLGHSDNSQSGSASSAESLDAISLTELSQHADPLDDCWLAIHGFVWDLTDYGVYIVYYLLLFLFRRAQCVCWKFEKNLRIEIIWFLPL